MSHELRKTGRSERPSERSIDDGNVISRGMAKSATQVGMKMGFDIHASLAPRVNDARCGLVDLAPSHSVNISTRGTNVQHQAVGGALLRAKRPVALKSRGLGIGPGANCAAFRALYSDRRIMSKLQRIAVNVLKCFGPWIIWQPNARSLTDPE